MAPAMPYTQQELELAADRCISTAAELRAVIQVRRITLDEAMRLSNTGQVPRLA